MTDYAALKAELARPDLAGLDDAAIAAALNAEPVILARDVAVSAWEGALRLMGAITDMQDWLAANPTASPARTAVGDLLGVIGGKIETVQMSLPMVAATIENYLHDIVGAGLLSEGEAAYLLSFAEHSTTRAAQLGWPGGLTDQEVIAARAFE